MEGGHSCAVKAIGTPRYAVRRPSVLGRGRFSGTLHHDEKGKDEVDVEGVRWKKLGGVPRPSVRLSWTILAGGGSQRQSWRCHPIVQGLRRCAG